MKLKPLNEQVVVLLGASSGIGRETALQFARRGAKVVVAARSEPGLSSLVDEIKSLGGEGTYVVCDVTDFAQVEAVADTAVRTFGRIDTWVNIAGVSVYAKFEDTTLEEFRRVLDVNFMGQVHGAKAALPRLRREGRGAIIAISSVESIVSMPLHSAYAASKHAVEGAFDALRRELMADGVPISITSVKPGSIDTPFFDNARSKMDVKPQPAPPVYEPRVVAECVLYAAEHPVRDLFAGGAAKALALGQSASPRMVDRVLARRGIQAQRTDERQPGGQQGNLLAPRDEETRIDGDFGGKSRRFSLFTWMETHPRAVLASGVLAGAAMILARRTPGDMSTLGPVVDEGGRREMFDHTM